MGQRPAPFQILRLHVKILGWLPAAGTALFLGVYLLLVGVLPGGADQTGPIAYLHRAVEIVAPLIFSLQVAFSLAPEGEQALELLLSSPVPLSRLLWQRLGALSLLYGGVSVAATLIIAALPGRENLGLALLRWLAAGTVLGGVALLATQLTRQGVFGALLATLLSVADLYGGAALLNKWPKLWPIHIYLQPQETTLLNYLLNRLCLLLIGMGLILTTSLLLRDEERALGIR